MVGVAADGREAVREVVLQRPDVAVLDLQMPGQDGFAAPREIARVAPEVAVLVLTMSDDDDRCSPQCVPAHAAMWSRRRAGGDRPGHPGRGVR